MELRKRLVAGIVIALISAMTTSAYAITQLGFALDESGSIGAADYAIERAGLAAAIGALPTDGTLEITVVSFADGVQTLVAPTVLTAATAATIAAQINGDGYTGGTTNTAAAITTLTSLMVGSSNFVAATPSSLINISTDGFPNSQSGAVSAATAAAAAGIDSISFEVISGTPDSIAAAAAIAFPGPVTILPTNSVAIPNPLGGGGSFVVPVSNIAAYAPVILAKVQSVAQVPVSGSLGLMLLGIAAFGLVRVRSTRQAA